MTGVCDAGSGLVISSLISLLMDSDHRAGASLLLAFQCGRSSALANAVTSRLRIRWIWRRHWDPTAAQGRRTIRYLTAAEYGLTWIACGVTQSQEGQSSPATPYLLQSWLRRRAGNVGSGPLWRCHLSCWRLLRIALFSPPSRPKINRTMQITN